MLQRESDFTVFSHIVQGQMLDPFAFSAKQIIDLILALSVLSDTVTHAFGSADSDHQLCCNAVHLSTVVKAIKQMIYVLFATFHS